MVFRQLACLGCLAVAVLLSGCGKSSPFETVPVSGKVQMEGGATFQGMAMKSIRFTPDDTSAKSKAGSGTIQDDGSFKVGTMTVDDGAVPGKYTVSVVLYKNYPPTPADLGTAWLCEPAQVEVTDGMEPVTIKVTKQKK